MSHEAVYQKIKKKIDEGKWTLDEVEAAAAFLRQEKIVPQEASDLPDDDRLARLKLAAEEAGHRLRDQGSKLRQGAQQSRKGVDLGAAIGGIFEAVGEVIGDFFDEL